MPTIAHISDLHLQSGVPARQSQVEPILQKINEMKPDLVVISGDVTDDGWDSIEELKWAKDWLEERIDETQMVLPGNHDVGNFANLPEGAIDAQRHANWGEVFDGPTLIDLNGLLVLGLNSMLFGSMLPAESAQQMWLTESMERHAGIAMIFLHSPLFLDRVEEAENQDADYWLGPQAPRLEVLYTIPVEVEEIFIASGHVHQTRLATVDGIQLAWAPPASGTWVHAPGLPNPPMPEQTGFFLHTLHDDGQIESELIECAPMLKLYQHKP